MVKLGDQVKDSITGFQGTAVARIEYLYGCIRIQVQSSQLKEDGSIQKAEWIDEPQLVGITSGAPAGYRESPPSRDP